MEGLTTSVLLGIDLFVDVSLVHDHQQWVSIRLDRLEQQTEGLGVADVASQGTPISQKLVTRRKVFESQLDGQAECMLITYRFTAFQKLMLKGLV